MTVPGSDRPALPRCHVVVVGDDHDRVARLGLSFARRIHRPFRDLINTEDLAPADETTTTDDREFDRTPNAGSPRLPPAADRLTHLLAASTEVVVAGTSDLLAAPIGERAVVLHLRTGVADDRVPADGRTPEGAFHDVVVGHDDDQTVHAMIDTLTEVRPGSSDDTT